METQGRYTLYGSFATRDAAALASVLVSKGVGVEWVDETASLAMALAARAGTERGPYLRTPEGFVLADVFAILDWLERVHPRPRLIPDTPVRRTCALLVEDWVALWLPRWPRRSWGTLERLGQHVEKAGYLLGPRPVRADWFLAAWLETEVLVHEHAREHLERNAPRLACYGDDLLGFGFGEGEGELEDDVLPISLLPVIEEIASDYHAYLDANHQALKDHEDHVMLDLGLGKRALAVDPTCERRRVEIGRFLANESRATRRRVSGFLEPLHAWHVLTLPPVLSEPDPSDPRSL